LRRINLYIGDKNSGETARRNAGRTDNAFTIRDEDDATILDAASVDGARDANPSTLPQSLSGEIMQDCIVFSA
jgi:hypothetical protein